MHPTKKGHYTCMLFLILFLPFFPASAASSSPEINVDSLSHQVDIKDVFRKVFRIKKGPKTDSINNSKAIYFAVLPGVGYTLQTGFTGIVSNNISFYWGDRKVTYLSAFNIDFEYSPVLYQSFLPAIFNIWSPGNKYNIVGDCRYYKFPSYTYGVGPYTKGEVSDLINYSYGKVYLVVFKPLRKYLYAGLGYHLDDHWNISSKTDNTDFTRYNNHANRTISSGISANIKIDQRENSNNPQRGNYCLIAVRSNLKILGSDQNWQSVQIDFRKYIPVGRNQILAFWSYDNFTFGPKIPYLDLPSNGWDTFSNTGRGYIQGRFRGRNMIYGETEYRFGITRNGLLGGVLFANAQSYSPGAAKAFQRIIPAGGAGIRIKINKNSNVNFAMDYAIGIDGSKGFFFNVCEVF